MEIHLSKYLVVIDLHTYRNYIAFVSVLEPNLRLYAWQLHAPVQKLDKQA